MSAVSLPTLTESGLSHYMEEIRKFPMLEPAEEVELAKRLHDHGDMEAAHRMVTSHLRLVVKIAMGFRGYGLPVSDLISEGNIGLMQAVKKFDHTKGFRLSTYAMWWIRAAITEYVLRSWSLVKMGTSAAQKKLFFNLRRMKGRLTALSNRDLTPAEVSEISSELNVPERDVIEMDRRLGTVDKSLQARVSDDDSSEYGDYLQDEEPTHDVVYAEQEDLSFKRGLFKQALEFLNDREKDIIAKRKLTDTPLTLEELSETYGVSRERIRQVEARAMEKLQAQVAKLMTELTPKALPHLA